ncbi:MAG: hypothetical protein U0L20_05965, partial [Ruminococcus sp.]|nr:hypothetical protein [Ruminococcus sp.]
MKKRILTISLACALIIASTASAINLSAEQITVEPVTYYSDQSNYMATKLSHPQNGPGVPDGLVDYVGNGVVTDQLNGVGDRAQNYSWSAQG